MTKPSHEEIAVRAYYLWEDSGRPENLDVHFWLIAEFELLHSWHKLPRSKRHVRPLDPFWP